MKKSRRKTAKLEKRLLGYSAAAGAVLLGASQADAASYTVISGTNFSFNGSPVGDSNPPTLSMDPENPTNVGELQFAFNSHSQILLAQHIGSGASQDIEVDIVASVAIAFTGTHPALKFHFGDAIASAGRHFTNFSTASGAVLAKKNAGGFEGNFQQALGGTGYLGFKFANGANDYYGWLKAKVAFDGTGAPLSISLIPKDGTTDVYGAYGDNTITAGAVPEPSTAALGGLALLALGGVGVREMRRRRAAKASA